MLQEVNPAGVETANFKGPSAEESAHDFLWRVHRAIPRRGDIGVFNRSHYEAVLVERVHGGLPERAVKQRYRQIVDFERLLGENGVVGLKLFLHLGRDEQRKRFEERLVIPRKKWKFSAGDLEIRGAGKSICPFTGTCSMRPAIPRRAGISCPPTTIGIAISWWQTRWCARWKR